MNTFDGYASFYDLLNSKKDYEGEAAYLVELARRFLPEINSILDLGCGTGRHAALMVKDAGKVVGVEISESMLARANELRNNSWPSLTEKLDFVQGDVRSFRLDQTFDVITSVFHVLSYQTTDSDVEQMLASVAKHLNPGGVFIFDFWFTPAVVADPPTLRIRRAEDDHIYAVRIAEPDHWPETHRVDVNYEILIEEKRSHKLTRINEKHKMRYFDLSEVARFLSKQGLAMLHSENWLVGGKPDDKHWGVCVVANKPVGKRTS